MRHRAEPTDARVPDYWEIAPHLRTGDIYLAAGVRKISRIIEWASGLLAGRGKDHWSHVGMVVIPAEIGLEVARPDQPHLWESTIDLGVPDAVRGDFLPGPMVVPLVDRLRDASAEDEPHYEGFGIRRLYYRNQRFAAALDPQRVRTFASWMERTSNATFSMWRLFVDWIRADLWRKDLKSLQQKLRRGEVKDAWPALRARRLDHQSGALTPAIPPVALPGQFARGVVAPLEGMMRPFVSEAVRRTLDQGWRLFRNRNDYPCSILATASLEVLGALDDRRDYIPAFTPTDFALDRAIPLRDGFEFGPIERFSFEQGDSDDTRQAV